MKNFKFNAALLALFLGVSLAFAFKAPAAPRHFTNDWYVYDGSGGDTDPSSYMDFGPTQPTCGGTTRLCAIQAADNGSGEPVITSGLSADITNAVTNHKNLADVKLKP